jgi:multidrug efflux pump
LDYRGFGSGALAGAVQNVLDHAKLQPELTQLFSSFNADQPQLFVDVDRVKAKAHGVALSDVFDALRIYLGSAYVNDVTLLNRNWKVMVQADAHYRLTPADIANLKVRNAQGAMVPLSTMVAIKNVTGPAIINRYNLYPAADISVLPAAGYSSSQAIRTLENVARQELPEGMGFTWSEITYQELEAEKDLLTKLVFPLSIVFVFLVLSAQYESWALPFAIILIVPMCLLAAVAGLMFMKMDNNVFSQIGLVVLVALAAKNAILVVEFAKQREDEGETTFDATVEAARVRLRPILMTSFAFILGVLPLAMAHGAGAEMRVALGVTVFSGMLGVTFFGLIFTPVFYLVVRKLKAGRKEPAKTKP